MEKHHHETRIGTYSKGERVICKVTDESKDLLHNPTLPMPTVIETLAEYKDYLQYDRRCKPETLRGVDASLKNFCELYGTMDTKELKATDMKLFFDLLKNKKRKRRFL